MFYIQYETYHISNIKWNIHKKTHIKDNTQ